MIFIENHWKSFNFCEKTRKTWKSAECQYKWHFRTFFGPVCGHPKLQTAWISEVKHQGSQPKSGNWGGQIRGEERVGGGGWPGINALWAEGLGGIVSKIYHTHRWRGWWDLLHLKDGQHIDATYGCPIAMGLKPGIIFQLHVTQHASIKKKKTSSWAPHYAA